MFHPPSPTQIVECAPKMMIREQDRTIDSIAGTLSTLAQQAGLMGQEIVEHNECAARFVAYHVSISD